MRQREFCEIDGLCKRKQRSSSCSAIFRPPSKPVVSAVLKAVCISFHRCPAAAMSQDWNLVSRSSCHNVALHMTDGGRILPLLLASIRLFALPAEGFPGSTRNTQRPREGSPLNLGSILAMNGEIVRIMQAGHDQELLSNLPNVLCYTHACFPNEHPFHNPKVLVFNSLIQPSACRSPFTPCLDTPTLENGAEGGADGLSTRSWWEVTRIGLLYAPPPPVAVRVPPLSSNLQPFAGGKKENRVVIFLSLCVAQFCGVGIQRRPSKGMVEHGPPLPPSICELRQTGCL